MSAEKIEERFEICEDHREWLSAMVEKYDLPDESKALRIILDYCKQEGDLDTIFQEIRCHHC